MYTCGPTVYGRPHIGNYSSFLMADLLRRWLETGHGLTVKHVKNITDVGHLVADADTGEDKVEREAKQEKVDPLEIARRYTEQYLEDERALNMLEPMARPRATEYVTRMIELTQNLLASQNAYETGDGIYFSVETFPAYGALSGNTLKNLSAGARIAVDEEKRHPADFALWKKCVGENAHHILRWPSPWGEGFPGWHIECSAMGSALLGPTIDIHTGGEDNIFPHHECEIAQSECALKKSPAVRYWVHKRRIDLGAEKMSKSLGNVLTIPDILERKYSPLDLRYCFLSVHYRTNLKFTWKGMDDARKARQKVMEWMDAVTADAAAAVPRQSGQVDTAISDARFTFIAAMDADLNTPGALAAIFSVMNAYYARKAGGAKLFLEDARELQEFIVLIRRTFGCFDSETLSIPSEVQSLLEARAGARASKDFKESDRIRQEIIRHGFDVRDTASGQQVRKL
jgi:cysteinyl-tRNA synthetase